MLRNIVLSAVSMAVLLMFVSLPAQAQESDVPPVISDEAKVPDYELPAILELESGERVEQPGTWWQSRRPQLLRLFKKHMYGQLPGEPPTMRIKQHEVSKAALDGEATRRQLTIHFTDKEQGPQLEVLIYLPNDVAGPAPVFTMLNFDGNHATWPDPEIRKQAHLNDARGSDKGRYPIDQIIDRGYGVVTAYYGDLFPDRADGFQDSVYQMFKDDWGLDSEGGNWSAISAWAWGLHRMMDYCEQASDIDSNRVVVMGHSRLGKTALWAGATDQRFVAVIDNASGCGGSALFRRRYGERAYHIDTNFPHWFRDRFSEYRENESALPVDQHQLLALSAPRPLLVNAMTKDQWADPKGMFLSAKHASAVWRFLGEEGLAAESMPGPGEPILSRVGYHLRAGEHDVTPEDWAVYLDFADKHVSAN
jgi:hypothetical protein